MDQDILNDFHESILPYLNDFTNFDYILSLLIRDIRNNNIIYINLNNSWYEYNTNLKKWISFDFNKVLNNISNFYELFNSQLINYLINTTILNTNNKSKFSKISKKISIFIIENKYNKSKINEYCCNLFSINNNI
jgi:hypothetical protein